MCSNAVIYLGKGVSSVTRHSIFVLITCRSRHKVASCHENNFKTASCGAALCCLSRNLFHAINAKRIKYLKTGSRKVTMNQPQRGVRLLNKDVL